MKAGLVIYTLSTMILIILLTQHCSTHASDSYLDVLIIPLALAMVLMIVPTKMIIIILLTSYSSTQIILLRLFYNLSELF